MNNITRVSTNALSQFAHNLLCTAGMAEAKAATVARLLVQTDMMQRHTHGVALIPLYLDQLRNQLMEKDGAPEVVKDTGSTVVWDGRYLPGLWLMDQALNLAFERVPEHGVVTFAIRRSHHIACLAALVKEATDKGYVAILATSDPSGKFVAPFGGRDPVMTPNPFAIGYPGTTGPVLVDICASITTVSMARTKAAAGVNFDYPWLMDNEGNPTTDPRVLEQTTPRGSLMLLGGAEYGHKGFGLALMVEALTQGLSGHGRIDAPNRWGANVFLQVLDPQAFAGSQGFLSQMDFIGDACRASTPVKDGGLVRLPGDQANRNILLAQSDGIALSEVTLDKLAACAKTLGVVPMPAA
ncbi:MAG: Ldh family oxidoreductase [Rhodoferax sp.]|uniref:Ldh family oxidoreductase n=1 Tax=Rhodoferax sp. TaxID=50421 RepID=UPI00273529D1|nr:Ldh family oxidoreductase [Rhodoferax sp.]MDP2680935.1 Ldh family oxidoreductase [Rhodoferax sp.]